MLISCLFAIFLIASQYSFNGLYDCSIIGGVINTIRAFAGASANNATSVTDTVFRYDEATNDWSTLPVMPIAVRDAAAAFASNGRIYILGGATAAGATAAVQSFDPTSNS